MNRIPVKEIYSVLSDLNGNVGHYIEDCESGEVFTINPDRIFPAASVIKIPMLALLLHDAQQGEIDLYAPHKTAESNYAIGTGIINGLSHELNFNLHDMAKLMVILSDNTATNEIMDIIGIERFNKVCKEWGYNSITLGRKMMDFEAIRQGRNNYMSAGDAGRIFSAIAKGTLVSAEVSKMIFDMMAEQLCRNKLPALLPVVAAYSGVAGLPDGKVMVANKTGGLVSIQHDAGIFMLPDGRRYIIAMFTDGLEDDLDGITAISKVSLAVYNAMK